MGFWDVVETGANVMTLGGYDAVTSDGADGPIKQPKLERRSFDRGGAGADTTESAYNAAASNYRGTGATELDRSQAIATDTRVRGQQGNTYAQGRARDQNVQ